MVRSSCEYSPSTRPGAGMTSVDTYILSVLERSFPATPALTPLHHEHPAVDLDRLAVDEAGCVRAEEQNRIGNFIVSSETSGGRHCNHVVQHLLGGENFVKMIVHGARAHGVDPDALAGEFLRHA